MLKPQRGLSIIALILTLFAIVLVLIFGMKVVPSFIEYRAARNAVVAIAAQNLGTPAEVRKAFELRAAIDDINSIKPNDLDISKDGNSLVVSFAYRKEVPLFRGVGLYIDYTASAGGE